MPKPNHSPAALRGLLQQELAVAKRLTVLAEAESAAIIANDTARLNALEQELKACVEQQVALDKARQNMTRALAWSLGLEQLPTLSALLPLLSPREQGPLQQVRAQLLDAQRQLEILNARNRQLLDNALDYVRFSLELLTTAALQPARYGTNLASISAPSFYIDSKA